jgi:hypothetical protein
MDTRRFLRVEKSAARECFRDAKPMTTEERKALQEELNRVMLITGDDEALALSVRTDPMVKRIADLLNLEPGVKAEDPENNINQWMERR